MTNRGVAPLDPTTPVGQVRANVGDTVYAPLEPAEEGYGDYVHFSDTEIEAWLTSAGDSVARATGLAYTALAAHVTTSGSGRSVKTNDLAVGEDKRADTLLKIAQTWFDRADAADEADADVFDIVGFAGFEGDGPHFREGSIRPLT